MSDEKTSPFFSIIVPVYNAGRYLSQCLSSIVNQTCYDYELLIVDDGSKDNSFEICKKFQSINIRIIHQENSGVSAARNIGLSLARGQYVIFIDADDYIERTFLETIYYEIHGYDILFWGNLYHYENGETVCHQPEAATADNRECVEKEILKLKRNHEGFEYFGYTWGKAFRRELIEEGHLRFVVGLAYREDELFTAEYCRYVKFLKVISQPIYNYRVLTAGLTARPKSIDTLSAYLRVMKEQISFWQYKDLRDYEFSRYVNVLFRVFYAEHGLKRKWQIAKVLNKCYSNNSENQFITRSRIFSLPKPLMAIGFLIWMLSNRLKNVS